LVEKFMLDPLQSLPGYLLRRASAAITAELSATLAPFDLRIAELSVLLLIEANPGITQSALGRALDIQRANMTPLTARLGERGLIERQQVDGRSQGLALTHPGKSLTSKAQVAINAFEEALTARVPAVHRAHLIPVLKALWQQP
jgi:DNA-binding MarR family transcriptional regulator